MSLFRLPPRVLSAALAFAMGVVVAAPALAVQVNGVGLIDYRKRNFKVGDWVRYKVDTANSNGRELANLQEVAIVGEEPFRGEPCFWVETWFGPDSTRASYDLTLMSARAFQDPQSDVRFSVYQRLVMTATEDDGTPVMTEVRLPPGSPTMPDLSHLRGDTDTLGVEKVETAFGPIEGQVVTLHRKLRNPRDEADSTTNRITDLHRKMWLSRRIPITSLAKQEETEDWFVQRYKVGEVSTNAPEVQVSSETRTAEIVAWGNGYKSLLLPLWKRRELRPKTDPNAPPGQDR